MSTPLAANVSRKRQRNRRIIESSPPPEAGQTEPQSSTEMPTSPDPPESQFLDEIFSQGLEADVHSDDPEIDRRTQNQEGLDSGDDNDEDDSGTMSDDRSTTTLEYQVPEEIRLLEYDANEVQDTSIHQTYTGFLSTLCRETSTQDAETHTLAILPRIIGIMKSISIGASMVDNEALDLYAYALVIHTWHLICQWVQHGVYPDGGSLSTQWGAYFLSAHYVVSNLHDICYEELKFAVEHWEERLEQRGGENPRLIASVFRGVPDTGMSIQGFRNETAARYLEALERGGRLDLALLILDKSSEGPETPLRDLVKNAEYKRWMLGEVIEVLASMDTEVLTAIIDGQLPRKAEIPFQGVSQALRRLDERQRTQPVTYMNSIVDAKGISPTPRQWQIVCDLMQQYIQPGNEYDPLAAEIDQLICPSTKWPEVLAQDGLRRYTEWRSWVEAHDKHPCYPRRNNIDYFVDQMRVRLETETRLRGSNTPLIAPVVEIGFTIDSKRRLRDHRRHRNSNYIMNLAQATFEYAYPGMFRLQQRIIYACWRSLHPWFSEIYLTQIGQGYTQGAGGFSHYPAGRSNGSAYRETSDEDWIKYRNEALRHGHLVKNLREMPEISERRYQGEVKAREMKAAVMKVEEEWLEKFAEVVGAATLLLQEEARQLEANRRLGPQ